MYTAYFDESGSPDDAPAVVVAGFVALDESWVKFDPEWRAVLREYRVSSLHMKEYAHSRREFASWKGDEKKRKKFLETLISVMKRYTLRSFAQGVIMADYRTIDQASGHLLEFLGEAYSLCARTCVKDVNSWATRRRYNRCRIKTVFEDGAVPKGKFIERMKADKQPAPIFEKKNACAPFQAADLLAYELLKRYRDVNNASNRDPRGSLLSLSEIPGKEGWGMYTEKDLDLLHRKVEELMEEEMSHG